jgi:hypothetical protein
MSYLIEQQRLKGVNLPRSGLLEPAAEEGQKAGAFARLFAAR